eukprot:356742-Chlamydomonas_euryale.AAC.3
MYSYPAYKAACEVSAIMREHDRNHDRKMSPGASTRAPPARLPTRIQNSRLLRVVHMRMQAPCMGVVRMRMQAPCMWVVRMRMQAPCMGVARMRMQAPCMGVVRMRMQAPCMGVVHMRMQAPCMGVARFFAWSSAKERVKSVHLQMLPGRGVRKVQRSGTRTTQRQASSPLNVGNTLKFGQAVVQIRDRQPANVQNCKLGRCLLDQGNAAAASAHCHFADARGRRPRRRARGGRGAPRPYGARVARRWRLREWRARHTHCTAAPNLPRHSQPRSSAYVCPAPPRPAAHATPFRAAPPLQPPSLIPHSPSYPRLSRQNLIQRRLRSAPRDATLPAPRVFDWSGRRPCPLPGNKHQTLRVVPEAMQLGQGCYSAPRAPPKTAAMAP